MNGHRANGPWDKPHHEHNARVVARHMDSEHYVRDLTARDIIPGTASGAADARVNGVNVVTLPDAGSPLVEWDFLRPAQWLNGQVNTQIFYAHSATGQAAITTLVARAHTAATTTLGVTGGLSASITFAATGGANRLEQITTLTPTLSVDQRHSLLAFRLTRDSANGSDGTADLYIVGVRHTFIPARQEI